MAQENEGYLVIIRCGAFFISIGANAIALSNELGLKLTCLKKGLCKVGVPINSLYNYVKKLSYECLMQVHLKSRKGKSMRKEIIQFNLKQEEYIMWLYDQLKNRTYRHSDYT